MPGRPPRRPSPPPSARSPCPTAAQGSATPVAERVRALDDAVRRLRDGDAARPLPMDQAERIFTLTFAIQELSRDVDEVARRFSAPDAGDGQV